MKNLGDEMEQRVWRCRLQKLLHRGAEMGQIAFENFGAFWDRIFERLLENVGSETEQRKIGTTS